MARSRKAWSAIDVYQGLKPWPRSYICFYLTGAAHEHSFRRHETVLRVAAAGDSVVPFRWVPGTMPVEDRGSVHFTIPATREIFFLALDEDDLALQPMRSTAQVRSMRHF